jgi:hypothetical protein
MLLGRPTARAGVRTAAMAAFATLLADVCHMAAVLADRFAAFLAYLGHMLAVLAYGFTAFASGFASFLRGEFVSVAAFVRGASAFAGDFALLGFVHTRKAASAALAVLVTSVCHDLFSRIGTELRHTRMPRPWILAGDSWSASHFAVKESSSASKTPARLLLGT